MAGWLPKILPCWSFNQHQGLFDESKQNDLPRLFFFFEHWKTVLNFLDKCIPLYNHQLLQTLLDERSLCLTRVPASCLPWLGAFTPRIGWVRQAPSLHLRSSNRTFHRIRSVSRLLRLLALSLSMVKWFTWNQGSAVFHQDLSRKILQGNSSLPQWHCLQDHCLGRS